MRLFHFLQFLKAKKKIEIVSEVYAFEKAMFSIQNVRVKWPAYRKISYQDQFDRFWIVTLPDNFCHWASQRLGVDWAEDGEGDHDVDRALVLCEEVDQRLGSLGGEGQYQHIKYGGFSNPWSDHENFALNGKVSYLREDGNDHDAQIM